MIYSKFLYNFGILLLTFVRHENVTTTLLNEYFETEKLMELSDLWVGTVNFSDVFPLIHLHILSSNLINNRIFDLRFLHNNSAIMDSWPKAHEDTDFVNLF